MDPILDPLRKAALQHDDWRHALRPAPNIHIAVMRHPFLSYVLDGSKTIESRFSAHRIAPYQQVQPGDRVLMKSGPIVGCFTAGWVKYFDFETDSFDRLVDHYGEAIQGDSEFWQTKRYTRYATLIGIEDARTLPPVSIPKSDRRAWVVIPTHRT